VKFKDNKITEEVGQSILETLTGLLQLGSTASVVISSLGKVYPRLTSTLLRLCQQDAKTTKSLVTLYDTSLDDWLNKTTCILPSNVFSLAMTRDWPGCWSLASRLAEASFNPAARPFRRNAAISILSSIFENKVFCSANHESVSQVAEQLLPRVTQELNKIGEVAKVNPKYLGEMFSVLANSKEYLSNDDLETITAKLEQFVEAWPKPKYKKFEDCKKQLKKLLKAWNFEAQISYVVPTSGSKKQSSEVNGAMNGEGDATNVVDKKKKKKKKKSQENLKEVKENKLKLAQLEEDSKLPSFVDLANNEANLESGKRTSGDNDQVVKSKKKKKSK